MTVFTSACPRNCYSTCSLLVHVENGKIMRIDPHPDNKATREGICLKGQSYIERVYSKERIYYPLGRNDHTKEFERISWDEAIDTISGKLKNFREEFGPQSVMFITGSGTKGLLNHVSTAFWRLFGGYTGTYGDLCWPSGLEATRLTLGDNRHSAPWDIADSKLIICWGKNPAETNIHQTNFINIAKEKGARLIVIDPRRTPTADRADLLVQPRPGTDGALALGIANLIIKSGNINRRFIDKYVLGYKKFAKAVDEYTVETVSKMTDIPVEYIEELAEYIGTMTPTTICSGFGMQRFSNSGQTMRALIALLAITGNIGKKGAGWVYANLSTHIFDRVKDPIHFFPPEKEDGIARISVSLARLGRDMLKQKDPPIKMIWVERGNPVLQVPQTPMVLEAFGGVDFRVVVDHFITDTAKQADIILPARSLFEQTDILNAYWHDYIQLQQKIIEPPKEVKPLTEVYRLLAQKLGFSKKDIKEQLPGQDESEVLDYLERRLAPFPEISLEKLKQGPVLSPCFQEIAWEDFRFKTPSGKIELFSREANQRWGVDFLPGFSEPIESVKTKGRKEYPFCLLTPNEKNSIHSQFRNLKVIRELQPEPMATLHPLDAKQKMINEGEKARIYNERGELEIRIKVDYSIKQGCVVIPNGWWFNDGAAVNLLTKGRETDMGYGTAFHDTTVQVERIGKRAKNINNSPRRSEGV